MEKQNIGVVTTPLSEAGNTPLSNLVDILCPLANDIHLITGNEGYTSFKNDKRIHTYGVRHEMGVNVVNRILKYIHMQLRISYKLAKTNGNVNIWIFFIGGDTLLIPMLTAKLLTKKVILVSAGSTLQSSVSANDNLSKQVKILERINRALSNRIIIYSPNLIKEWDLEKYRNKISVAHKHFLDFDQFKIKRDFDERENLVGCIGRLSGEKGTLNFVEAIPQIIKERSDVEFLIVGDGRLRNEIENYLNENNITDRVKLTGWIPHDELPDYLNELKLVVLPSYTEGLPNLMLEAMACGTPILATPVGAIPDVITDGATGFILEDNSPACVAENVIRALEHFDLETIVENARVRVEREFTYEAAVEKYRMILESV